MSQGLQAANNDGLSLFACTKCNQRVRSIEELSQGSQLCKDCKGSFLVVKCTYCRTEYQQESTTNGKSTNNNICKKCEHLQEQHGKPKPCAYCNIIAAFIGTRCQRCTNSEKKYGPPLSCDHCKQKCAFDRKDTESRKKVDGKLLCWLCTMSYKRTLAKARHKEAILKSASYGSNHRHRSSNGSESKSTYSTSAIRHHHQHTSNGSQRGSHNHPSSVSVAPGTSNSSSTFQRSTSQRHSHQNTSSSTTSNLRESSSTSYSSSDNKKPRLDISQQSSNLSTSMSSSLSDARFIDPNNIDLTSAVAQLKDQVAMLNKKVQIKEKELLAKDQQIADLKSTSAREQRELRDKINSLQKEHTERISEMQAKLVGMQKQIASQTRAPRTNLPSGIKIEPPLVI